MKTHTFSIVVGNGAYNANCPFCISKMTASEVSGYVDFDEGRFNIAMRVVEQMKEGLLLCCSRVRVNRFSSPIRSHGISIASTFNSL